MSARSSIAILFLGLALQLVGSLFKVMHWPNAGELLIAATLFEIGGLAILAVKLARYPKFKDFLDS